MMHLAVCLYGFMERHFFRSFWVYLFTDSVFSVCTDTLTGSWVSVLQLMSINKALQVL